MKIKFSVVLLNLSLLLSLIYQSATAEQTTPVSKKIVSKVIKENAFHRLTREYECNTAPINDGIHDPDNEAVHTLQDPKTAFQGFPKVKGSNCVDWVQALSQSYIDPRYDRFDPNIEPLLMPLDIEYEMTGDMQNVIFPHKQHTQWLHCSNCHPKIFIPKKGAKANKVSMEKIFNYEKCGKCHGRVAFRPETSTCKRCHSKPKPKGTEPARSEPGKLKYEWEKNQRAPFSHDNVTASGK